jgi:hypothetical protein
MGKSNIRKSVELFPLKDNRCPICKKQIDEPNSYLYLIGGVMLKDINIKADDMHAFLEINFSGATGNGIGRHRNKTYSRMLIKNSPYGQFDLCFCSTECFRKYINSVIDEMEEVLTEKPQK